MANIKLIHNDSNTTRSKEKKERQLLLNQQLNDLKTDLRNTLSYEIFDSNIYETLIKSIEELNVQHLTNIDIFNLVEISNSMYLIKQLNDTISKFDDTNEYNERLKTIASRSSLLNTINKQLTDLMLSPVQRNSLLLESQSNIDSINFSDDEFSGILRSIS